MDGLAPDKGLKAQVEAAKRDYIVEPRLGEHTQRICAFGLLLQALGPPLTCGCLQTIGR